ncbi:hypothetical protein B6D60_00595 [candidate division KSB1 bacterium 4484_87]|nr:MAG: hypothetical protein B6D60_00595 [candidate division KSB1 bacterium 4484_87]
MIHNSRRILIVDDEENLTWSLARNLRRSFVDFEIFSTTSGKEAYQILKTLELDLLITDIKIPDMDGLSLLSFVRKNKPGLKVILMTSFNNPDYRHLADDVKVHFMEKPFDIEQLKKNIQHILQLPTIQTDKTLSGKSLTELIKKFYRSKFNGWLRVQNGHSVGELYFKKGVIIDAAADKLSGEMALIHLLNWKRVESAEMVPDSKPLKRTIYYGWKLLEKELLAA